MDPIKFPSVEQFRNVSRNVQWRAQYKGDDKAGEPIMDRLAKLPVLKFIGTEKLHGSNLSVRILKGGGIICQSRERIITPENDCYGFTKFIHSLSQDTIQELVGPIPDEADIVIYGEYAGAGIQNRVAISSLEKFWTIFAIRIVSSEGEERWIDLFKHNNQWNWNELAEYRIYSIYNNQTWEIDIDFEHPAESINKINEWTLEVEKESPFGLKMGVAGIGEGIVLKCAEPGYESSKFWMKSKGSEHSASKVRKLASVDIEKMKSIDEFIEKTVTEERLQQGWDHLQNNKLFDYEKSMGAFLSWVFQDVLKEEFDTMTESGLNKKDVGSACAKKAKVWYLEKLNTL